MSHGFCTPEQRAACPLPEHFTDEHHDYFPRRAYMGKLATTFRNLPENKQQLCRNEHNEIHATQRPPLKPDVQDMLAAIALSEQLLEGAA
jgi:hypothetical protein